MLRSRSYSFGHKNSGHKHMNEHELRRPMKRLAEVSGLTTLIERVPEDDRYMFSFEESCRFSTVLVRVRMVR